MLDEKGYKYEYYETGEGHIWKNWRIYLTEFAPKIFIKIMKKNIISMAAAMAVCQLADRVCRSLESPLDEVIGAMTLEERRIW